MANALFVVNHLIHPLRSVLHAEEISTNHQALT